jgi:hypothetical protein
MLRLAEVATSYALGGGAANIVAGGVFGSRSSTGFLSLPLDETTGPVTGKCY